MDSFSKWSCFLHDPLCHLAFSLETLAWPYSVASSSWSHTTADTLQEEDEPLSLTRATGTCLNALNSSTQDFIFSTVKSQTTPPIPGFMCGGEGVENRGGEREKLFCCLCWKGHSSFIFNKTQIYLSPERSRESLFSQEKKKYSNNNEKRPVSLHCWLLIVSQFGSITRHSLKFHYILVCVWHINMPTSTVLFTIIGC